MRRVYTPDKVRRGPVLPALAALGVTFLLFLVLPMTQLLSSATKPKLTLVRMETALPPPPPPPTPPPPPPDDSSKQDRQNVNRMQEQQIRLPDLRQLDMALNPGAGAAIQADYSVNLEGPDTAGDIKKMIFEMGEVDKLPEPIQQVDPQYPPKLFAARVGGTVTAVFVVDEQGNVRDITIREGAHYELGRAVTQALARWKWRPGTKNGEPVMVRFIKPFEFDPRAR